MNVVRLAGRREALVAVLAERLQQPVPFLPLVESVSVKVVAAPGGRVAPLDERLVH